MARARCSQIDLTKPGRYLCSSTCVRQSPYLNDGSGSRKAAVLRRIRKFSRAFVIDVFAASVVDTTLSIAVGTRPDAALRLSPSQTVRRWNRIYPANTRDRGQMLIGKFPDLMRRAAKHRVVPLSLLFEAIRRDDATIEELRTKLGSLSCFMKVIKQEISTACNRYDNVRGPFWDGRFDAIEALTDMEMLLSMILVDLMPHRAGEVDDEHPQGYSTWADRIRAREGGAQGGGSTGSSGKGGPSLSQAWLGSIRRAIGVSTRTYLRILDAFARAHAQAQAQAMAPSDSSSLVDLQRRLGLEWNVIADARLPGEGADGYAVRCTPAESAACRSARYAVARALPRLLAVA